MRNPLQEQLLKAGLAKKSKLDQVARDQAKQRHARTPAAPATEQADIERARLEKVERDRALSAERNAQARVQELQAQARQIVAQNKLEHEGGISYAFTDGGVIRNVLVNEPVRAQLAVGNLVIVRHGVGYALIPRVAADKVYLRDAGLVVLDHGKQGTTSDDGAEDDYYSQFKVPDDLIW